MEDAACVLVTGAAGFLGREVCAQLCAAGWPVLAAARSAPALEALRTRLRARGGACDTVRVDLAAAEIDVPDVGRVTRVIHLASPVPSVRANDVELFVRAEKILVGLMELERRIPALEHITFVSSVAVYGAALQSAAREDSPIPPRLGGYGAHKLLAESRLREVSHARGWSLGILRPTQIFGPGEPHGLGLTRIVRAAVRERRIVLENGGQDERDLVYVRDAAAAIVHACIRRLVGVFNVSTGNGVRFGDIADLVREQLGGGVDVLAKPFSRPPTRLVYDNSRLSEVLGFRPETPLSSGIHACVAYEEQAMKDGRHVQ
jgi:nucleoside-diphosphate-sugar epimerase